MVDRANRAFLEGGVKGLKNFHRERGRRRPGEPPDQSVGPMALGQTAGYLGAEVEQAAWALDFPDEAVFPQPVRHQGGYGVVIVLGRYEAPPPPSLEEEYDHVRRAVYERIREERLTPWVNAFRKNHRVTVNEEYMDLVPWIPPEPPRATAPGIPQHRPDGGPPDSDGGPADGPHGDGSPACRPPPPLPEPPPEQQGGA